MIESEVLIVTIADASQEKTSAQEIFDIELSCIDGLGLSTKSKVSNKGGQPPMSSTLRMYLPAFNPEFTGELILLDQV